MFYEQTSSGEMGCGDARYPRNDNNRPSDYYYNTRASVSRYTSLG